MAHETDEPRTDEHHHDQAPEYDHSHFEGGPVKTFLEHLEDLRWVLIKSLTAIGIAFTVCLLAGPQLAGIVTYPLKKAKIKHPKNRQFVTVSAGTNRLFNFSISTEQGALWATEFGSNLSHPAIGVVFTCETSCSNFNTAPGTNSSEVTPSGPTA